MFPVIGFSGIESKELVKRSTKAVLLSGLIFPGIGHIYLKLYAHGVMLSAGAASAIYYIVSVMVSTALEVAEKTQSGGLALDMGGITELVSQQFSSAEQPMNVAMIVFAALWVAGVADSYRQGRAQEQVAMGGGEKKHRRLRMSTSQEVALQLRAGFRAAIIKPME
jgi:hypothetical protein